MYQVVLKGTQVVLIRNLWNAARRGENTSFIIMQLRFSAIPCSGSGNFADCGPRLRALP